MELRIDLPGAPGLRSFGLMLPSQGIVSCESNPYATLRRKNLVQLISESKPILPHPPHKLPEVKKHIHIGTSQHTYTL